jgi:hypothetical protein
MKCKLITNYDRKGFEDDLENFVNDYDSYSVQYKPVCGGSGAIAYTALVMVPIEEEEKDEG